MTELLFTAVQTGLMISEKNLIFSQAFCYSYFLKGSDGCFLATGKI